MEEEVIIREKEKKPPREKSELEDMNKGMGSQRRRERVKSNRHVERGSASLIRETQI